MARTGHGVQHAIDVARRGTTAAGTHAGAIPFPDHFQVFKIVDVDFIGGRIAGMGKVIAEGVPLD